MVSLLYLMKKKMSKHSNRETSDGDAFCAVYFFATGIFLQFSFLKHSIKTQANYYFSFVLN